MSMFTRGYRPLVVAGRRFRWRCAFNHPGEYFSVAAAQGRLPPDLLLVRSEVAPQRVLTVEWDQFRWRLVTPRLVRACVEEALRRGWPDTLPALTLESATVPGLAEPEARANGT